MDEPSHQNTEEGTPRANVTELRKLFEPKFSTGHDLNSKKGKYFKDLNLFNRKLGKGPSAISKNETSYYNQDIEKVNEQSSLLKIPDKSHSIKDIISKFSNFAPVEVYQNDEKKFISRKVSVTAGKRTIESIKATIKSTNYVTAEKKLASDLNHFNSSGSTNVTDQLCSIKISPSKIHLEILPTTKYFNDSNQQEETTLITSKKSSYYDKKKNEVQSLSNANIIKDKISTGNNIRNQLNIEAKCAPVDHQNIILSHLNDSNSDNMVFATNKDIIYNANTNKIIKIDFNEKQTISENQIKNLLDKSSQYNEEIRSKTNMYGVDTFPNKGLQKLDEDEILHSVNCSYQGDDTSLIESLIHTELVEKKQDEDQSGDMIERKMKHKFNNNFPNENAGRQDMLGKKSRKISLYKSEEYSSNQINVNNFENIPNYKNTELTSTELQTNSNDLNLNISYKPIGKVIFEQPNNDANRQMFCMQKYISISSKKEVFQSYFDPQHQDKIIESSENSDQPCNNTFNTSEYQKNSSPSNYYNKKELSELITVPNKQHIEKLELKSIVEERQTKKSLLADMKDKNYVTPSENKNIEQDSEKYTVSFENEFNSKSLNVNKEHRSTKELDFNRHTTHDATSKNIKGEFNMGKNLVLEKENRSCLDLTEVSSLFDENSEAKEIVSGHKKKEEISNTKEAEISIALGNGLAIKHHKTAIKESITPDESMGNLFGTNNELKAMHEVEIAKICTLDSIDSTLRNVKNAINKGFEDIKVEDGKIIQKLHLMNGETNLNPSKNILHNYEKTEWQSSQESQEKFHPDDSTTSNPAEQHSKVHKTIDDVSYSLLENTIHHKENQNQSSNISSISNEISKSVNHLDDFNSSFQLNQCAYGFKDVHEGYNPTNDKIIVPKEPNQLTLTKREDSKSPKQLSDDHDKSIKARVNIVNKPQNTLFYDKENEILSEEKAMFHESFSNVDTSHILKDTEVETKQNVTQTFEKKDKYCYENKENTRNKKDIKSNENNFRRNKHTKQSSISELTNDDHGATSSIQNTVNIMQSSSNSKNLSSEIFQNNKMTQHKLVSSTHTEDETHLCKTFDDKYNIETLLCLNTGSSVSDDDIITPQEFKYDKSEINTPQQDDRLGDIIIKNPKYYNDSRTKISEEYIRSNKGMPSHSEEKHCILMSGKRDEFVFSDIRNEIVRNLKDSKSNQATQNQGIQTKLTHCNSPISKLMGSQKEESKYLKITPSIRIKKSTTHSENLCRRSKLKFRKQDVCSPGTSSINKIYDECEFSVVLNSNRVPIPSAGSVREQINGVNVKIHPNKAEEGIYQNKKSFPAMLQMNPKYQKY